MHPDTRWLRLERAEGGRQDLAFDGAVPLFVDRAVMLEFLRDLIFIPDHKNVLEDYLWTILSSAEVAAALRVYTLFDLLLSRPMRWLSGKGAALPGWSVYKMGEAFDGVEAALIAIASDGKLLFDPSVDFFESVAAEQPLFRAYRKAFFAQEVASIPGGKGKKHKIYQWALDEARAPESATYIDSEQVAIVIAEIMANAALAKLHDPNLALSQWLTSQDGENAFGRRAAEHSATMGANTVNCFVESNFGTYDGNQRCFTTAAPENIAGMSQQVRMKDFNHGKFVRSDRRKSKPAEPGAAAGADEADIGYFNKLPPEMKEAIVLVARQARAASRVQAKKDWEEQLAYRRERRKENLDTLLNATVERYANGLELFDAWKAHGTRDMRTIDSKLNGQSEASKLKFLRNEIEMRVIGLGWIQFETRWGSIHDENVGSLASLTELLRDILAAESTARRLKQLPTEAAPPPLRVRTLKDLGNLAADAKEIRGKVRAALRHVAPSPMLALSHTPPPPPHLVCQALFDLDELRTKAAAARQRRIAAGISDNIEDAQPASAPAWQDTLTRKIEVCWAYYLQDGSRQLIWTEGTVTTVADGESHKRTKACKKLLPRNAVYWEWGADAEHGEAAGGQWLVLDPRKWSPSVAVQYAWRWAPSELERLAAEAEARGDGDGAPAQRRQRRR